jgi:hypothetical protein
MSELDEILLEYGGYCSQQVEASDDDIQFHQAKLQLSELIEQQVLIGRIDELRTIMSLADTKENKRHVYDYSAMKINELTTLKAQLKKERNE